MEKQVQVLQPRLRKTIARIQGFRRREAENDFGVSISWGKTYYLHKKPLLGMLKFGLDWSLGRSELFEIHDLRIGRAGFGFRRRHYG